MAEWLLAVKTENFQSSTKVEALRLEIEAMLRYDASAKCIVFSQFTSMLDIVHFRLQQVRCRCTCLGCHAYACSCMATCGLIGYTAAVECH